MSLLLTLNSREDVVNAPQTPGLSKFEAARKLEIVGDATLLTEALRHLHAADVSLQPWGQAARLVLPDDGLLPGLLSPRYALRRLSDHPRAQLADSAWIQVKDRHLVHQTILELAGGAFLEDETAPRGLVERATRASLRVCRAAHPPFSLHPRSWTTRRTRDGWLPLTTRPAIVPGPLPTKPTWFSLHPDDIAVGLFVPAPPSRAEVDSALEAQDRFAGMFPAVVSFDSPLGRDCIRVFDALAEFGSDT